MWIPPADSIFSPELARQLVSPSTRRSNIPPVSLKPSHEVLPLPKYSPHSQTQVLFVSSTTPNDFIMSVEAATAQMANTTLNDTAAAVADGSDKQAQNDAVIASAAEGRRLYIGNLAYATTEGELKEFFKDYLVYACPVHAEHIIEYPC